MRRHLIYVVALADVAIVLLTPLSALAAMYASLSSNHGQPGDAILLLTDDNHGIATYAGLTDENNQAIYLSPTTSDPAAACGGASSQIVGRLQWRGNAAGLAFVIPNLPLADYWLFMETHGQCWRVAGLVGRLAEPLVLSIGTTQADNQERAKNWTVASLPTPRSPANPSPVVTQTSSKAPQWLVLAGSVFLSLALLTVGRLLRTRSSGS